MTGFANAVVASAATPNFLRGTLVRSGRHQISAVNRQTVTRAGNSRTRDWVAPVMDRMSSTILAERDLDDERRGRFQDAGEDLTVAVAAGGRIKNVRGDQRRA